MKKLERLFRIIKDERGSFGVKEIAITVAVIVVIGLVIGEVKGNMNTWVTDIWDMFIEQIKKLMN